jgi:hypothetical protein
MTLIKWIAPLGAKVRLRGYDLFFIYTYRSLRVAVPSPSGSSQKKTRPATRSRNASRSDPFDPVFPKYPDEPSVLDASRPVRS